MAKKQNEKEEDGNAFKKCNFRPILTIVVHIEQTCGYYLERGDSQP